MTITSNDFLTSTGFKLTLDSSQFPGINCTIQSVNIPSLSIGGDGMYATPYRTIPLPGDTYNFDPLTVTMILKHDMANYIAVKDWMTQCIETEDDPLRDKTSDIRISVFNNKNNLTKTFVFVTAFPSDLGTITFNITDASDDYITVDVTFQYAYFTIE